MDAPARTRNLPAGGWPGPVLLALLLAAGIPLLIAAGGSVARDDTDEHPGPREIYNEGTRKLRDGKLNEAEAVLESAVKTQNQGVQALALYNLGEVRFKQGMQEYTNAPDGKAVAAKSNLATQHGSEALKAADDALAGDDVQAMVSAYLRGRGARKELKTAIEAVKRAMDAYGVVLSKWRRASGDFKSTAELRMTDADALTNAGVVDRWIEDVLNRQQMLMSGQEQMQKQNDELTKQLQELGQKLPENSQQPSQPGQQKKSGTGDDEKPANAPKPGQSGENGSRPSPSPGGMESLRQQLGNRLQQLKQRLPSDVLDQLNKDGSGDDDDDDDKPQPQELKEGQKDGQTKPGKQMLLTREEAQRLLQLLRDPNRKLSLGGLTEGAQFSDKEGVAAASDRKGRDW
jgi:hypothetical protein